MEIDGINSGLSGLFVMDFLISPNGTKTIREQAHYFYQMLFIQGLGGSDYGSYALNGYYPGTSIRNHISPIGSGLNITITIDDNEFIVKSKSKSDVYCSIICVIGEAPVIV